MLEPSAAKSKPALDEESFTRLLAAAYVMQEHQDRLRARIAPADLTQIIAQVVETQHEIQSRSLDASGAFDLIAKRLCSVCGAAGVAVATVNGDNLRYRAGAGTAAGLVNSEMAKVSSLASSCLKTGTAFQSPLAQTDPRLNSAQCRKLGAQSLLAVPLYHNGQVVGTIEMYFSQVSGFGESENRAAELMAGIASEVIADAAEHELQEELESERASVLHALQMLEPELQKLAGQSKETNAAPSPPPATELCRACGHAFVGNETSCGVCGASRATGLYPGAALQSKWALLWEQHLSNTEQGGMPVFRKQPPQNEILPAEDSPSDSDGKADVYDKGRESGLQATKALQAAQPGKAGETETALELAPWNFEVDAQAVLSAHPKEKSWMLPLRIFRARPGDASLAVAALVLLVTLLWAFWPGRGNTSLANARPPAIAAVKRRPRPKPPKLTLFEQALVGLGLAVPPPTPEYMGDPNVKVWEDLQTGLYYCPDADLYGTTSKGSYTTQAEAQQDAFEPAFRKPCD